MQKRGFLALLLCLIIWLAYMEWVLPKVAPVPTDEEQQALGGDGEDGGAEPEDAGGSEDDGGEESVAETNVAAGDVAPRTDLRLRDDYLDLTFTNRGASLQSARLHQYKNQDLTGELELLKPFDPERLSFGLSLVGRDVDLLGLNWEVREETAERISFATRLASGLEIVKSFTLTDNPYRFDVAVDIRNNTPAAIALRFLLSGAEGIVRESPGGAYVRAVYAVGSTPGRRAVYDGAMPAKLVDGDKDYSMPEVAWGGIANRYFAAVLVPAKAGRMAGYTAHLVRDHLAEDGPHDDNVGVHARSGEIALKVSEGQKIEFRVFLGPKDASVLELYAEEDLPALVDYGWFGSISNVLLFILGIFRSLVGNYGVAIILLTMLVRMCVFPISKKGQVAMYRLQQLQPEVKVLRDRFKSNPQRMNQEMMALYKEAGVNPLAGCLPMFLQIPVFLGLYRALELNIGLRGQPFFGWMTDMSRPDVLAHLPFVIPFVGTNELHLMPILMTLSWFFQQFLAPRSPDPQMQQQQKMMMIMPLVFGFFLYSMPCGLNLYWFTSTLLGICEQQFIKKVILPRAAAASA